MPATKHIFRMGGLSLKTVMPNTKTSEPKMVKSRRG
jgi:hypothetical protein